MVEVLNAMQLLNRHVKDLKWIKEWLRVCKCPKERCPEFKRKQGYRSSLDDMDKAAYEHYGVQLNAACNVGYGTADSVPIIGFDDWDEAEYYIEEESSDFVYPDTDDIEELRSCIKQDYDYIYATSLTDLYDPLTMPDKLRKAHIANDKAVMSAYGFSMKMTEADCVAELMKLYQKLIAEKQK